jgi:hypothetical protein
MPASERHRLQCNGRSRQALSIRHAPLAANAMNAFERNCV